METRPLLRGDFTTPSLPKSPNRYGVLLLVALAIAAVDIGSALSYPANLAICESIICQELNRGDCKSSAVQGELALLFLVKDTMDQVPGLILGLFFGVAADRYGRRPILLMCLCGLFLQEAVIRAIFWWSELLPLRAIWASPLAQVLGGGPQIGTSIAYAMITDVFSPEDRSSVFFLVAAVILISEILASPLSSILMWKSSAWLPSLLGLALEALSIFFVFLLPETRPVPKRYLSESHADDPVNNAGAAVSASLTSKLKATLSRASSYWLLSPGILSILATFLFGSIGKQALQLVIQYASVRFDWSIAEATLLITIKGIVTLVVLLFALPQLSKLLDRHMESSKRELIVVQGSACLLTAGAFTMALSATPPLFIVGLSVLACGWGFYSALRSFAIGMVQADQVGAISTAVAMVQSAGTIMSGPLLASAFGFGLSHKGVWRGMPYMVAAIFFFVATCLVYYLSRKTSHKEGYRLQSQFEDEEPNPASEG